MMNKFPYDIIVWQGYGFDYSYPAIVNAARNLCVEDKDETIVHLMNREYRLLYWTDHHKDCITVFNEEDELSWSRFLLEWS